MNGCYLSLRSAHGMRSHSSSCRWPRSHSCALQWDCPRNNWGSVWGAGLCGVPTWGPTLVLGRWLMCSFPSGYCEGLVWMRRRRTRCYCSCLILGIPSGEGPAGQLTEGGRDPCPALRPWAANGIYCTLCWKRCLPSGVRTSVAQNWCANIDTGQSGTYRALAIIFVYFQCNAWALLSISEQIQL